MNETESASVNEAEKVSRRQFMVGGMSVFLGGLLGGLAGHFTAKAERKNEEAAASPSKPVKEGDRLPVDVLSGAVLDADPKSERFGGAILNQNGRLTQYIHVVPGLEVRLSRLTENGETVSWIGYDGGLSPVTVLEAIKTEKENGETDTDTDTDIETDMVLTIPEGLAFLRGSCSDGEAQPEIRVGSLAEYTMLCGIGRPDLSSYTEIDNVTLYPCTRRDDNGEPDQQTKAYPAVSDVFFTPIGTDLIVTFRNANIAPFLHCGENWDNMNRKTSFSRSCGFGYAWYYCKTTEVCNWLGACYEAVGGCAGTLTTEELRAADPHVYLRFPGRALPSREASRIRVKGVWGSHERQFTVVHLTDTHGDIDSTHAAYEYADQIGADFVAMTGDYVPFTSTHGFDMVHSVIRKARTPTVYTLGNHDVWDYTDQKVYDECIAPIRDVLQASEKSPYYYRDFQWNEEPVRVISLYPFYEKGKDRECGFYSQEQLAWLCETMAEVPDSGHIFIIRHFPHHNPIPRDYDHMMFYDYNGIWENDNDLWLNMDEDPVPAIVDAYNRKERITAEYTGFLADDRTETVTVDYDFSNRPNSEFVAYFTGHLHFDAIGYTRGTKTLQPVLCSICTAGVKGSEDYHSYTETGSARDYGTDSQIAFNVCTFDFRNKNIYIARVGNGIFDDKEKTWMVLPY
ncbi:MAG: metallophosphoesterase [Oscillospiraceae bacterium]|nr:metallophosphoesterase [Oscillospiraceae bacterium]